MSKLFNEYEKLKDKNKEQLYLFKSGIFFISLNEDAEKLSKLFDFKITNLNDTVVKCGFPAKRLEYYTNLLNACSVKFQVIDSNCSNKENNTNNSKIIETLNNLDMDKLSLQEAFNILKKIKEMARSAC